MLFSSLITIEKTRGNVLIEGSGEGVPEGVPTEVTGLFLERRQWRSKAIGVAGMLSLLVLIVDRVVLRSALSHE